MARQPLALSANYRAVVRAIRELHRLNQAGLEDSPEADAIRDAHDAAWEALSEVERKRIGGLSEDLYSLSEPPPGGAQPMDPQAQARLNDAFEARQHGDWDRALELLRRWSKDLSPALVSFLRGTIWRDAGDAETAVLFLEHAIRLEPDNANYLTFFLTVLDTVDPAQARQRADAIVRDPDRFPAAAVVRSAHLLLLAAPPPKPELSHRLIPVLNSALARILQGDEGGLDRQACVSALALLGVCLEALGNAQAAAECYSHALQIDPHDQSLLLARGVLLYGSPAAITDLQLAIQNGCPVFLPYYLLAHDALLRRDYPRCLALCEHALQQEAPSSIQSELAEWTAIAQAELGQGPDLVRAPFERALRLDPSNDRARRNLARFDAALASAQRVAWETRSAAAVRASGQAERRYALAA